MTLFVVCGKANFTNLSRYGEYSERTYRRQYQKSFDFIPFHAQTIAAAIEPSREQIAAIDCSFISKSGKQTWGVDNFYNGSISKSQKGLEISVISVVDVSAHQGYTICIKQTATTDRPSIPAHQTAKKKRKSSKSKQWHESIVKQGDLALVPAGQTTYWRGPTDMFPTVIPHDKQRVYLQPFELVTKTALRINNNPISMHPDRNKLPQIELIFFNDCFSRFISMTHIKSLYQLAMMLLGELRSGGIMGELYVESLTQVLVIHLLRQYSSLQPAIVNRHSLTPTRLKSAIDYIHAHLDGDLSIEQIASSVNTSSSHFAHLFKTATGISLYQYVIQQRVERAKLLLANTDLPISEIAAQVGFASPSHLTHHCKRQTGMTPRQIASNR